MTIVDNSVNYGSGKLFIGNNLTPFAEWKVGGYDQALRLVTIGYDAENISGAFPVNLAVAPFINDEKIKLPELDQGILKATFICCSLQLDSQLGKREELDFVIQGAGLEPKADREHCFPAAAYTDHDKGVF